MVFIIFFLLYLQKSLEITIYPFYSWTGLGPKINGIDPLAR
jgi:hypothetical protein